MNIENDFREFASFLKANEQPSSDLASAVQSQIMKELNPSLPKTVSKSFVLHSLGSLVTLLFCPQFGFSLTGTDGLMPYLMNIHPALCFFFCGMMWVVLGEVLSMAFLSFDEQRVLGRTRWGLTFSLLLLSLLGFSCFGRIQLDTWLAVWLGGAISITIVFNFQVIHRFRQTERLAQSTLK